MNQTELPRPALIGEIRDIDEIASRWLPLWNDIKGNVAVPFAQRRRLMATAIGQHLRDYNVSRDYLDEYITLPGREIPIRIYGIEHAARAPLIVYFHGGGWVSGNLDTHHGVCELLHERFGGAVISVHTRRAPENPHPAQVEDAVGAIEYLIRCNGLVEIGSSGLVLAGDSAGAFTAFRTALSLGGWEKLKGLLLFYPALEPDLEKASFRTHAEAPGLTTDTIRRYWDALIGGNERLRHALSLGAASGLDQLPPTVVMVAEHDPLQDDGTKLVSLLLSAKRTALAITALGTTHGFCRLVHRDPASKAWVEVALNKFSTFLGHT